MDWDGDCGGWMTIKDGVEGCYGGFEEVREKEPKRPFGETTKVQLDIRIC